MHNERISIVIPAFNEAHQIVSSLWALADYCQSHFAGYEILCIDDGSTDETAALVRTAGLPAMVKMTRLAHNRGKGHAVQAGMLQASGDYRFFTDADLPYDLNALNRALVKLRNGDCDIVAGQRTGAICGHHLSEPPYRKVASIIFRMAVHRLVRIAVRDSQCGFKGFSASAAEAVFKPLKSTGFAFDVEILHLANAMGLRVARLPVHLVHNGRSSVRLYRDSIAMFVDLLRIAWRYRQKGAAGADVRGLRGNHMVEPLA